VWSYPGLIWPERDSDLAGTLVRFVAGGPARCETTAVACYQRTAVAGPPADRLAKPSAITVDERVNLVPGALARTINAELAGTAAVPARP
jgi:hypothetical protein